MTLDTGAQTEVHVNRSLAESQPSLLSLLAWTLGKQKVVPEGVGLRGNRAWPGLPGAVGV